jgi:hypothetical protein
MALIPKLSKELILSLAEEVRGPEYPQTMRGWQGITEGELRRAAYLAGRRSLVDELIAALEEDNGVDTSGDARESFATVEYQSVGDGIVPHREVASIHMAPDNPSAAPDVQGYEP